MGGSGGGGGGGEAALFHAQQAAAGGAGKYGSRGDAGHQGAGAPGALRWTHDDSSGGGTGSEGRGSGARGRATVRSAGSARLVTGRCRCRR